MSEASKVYELFEEHRDFFDKTVPAGIEKHRKGDGKISSERILKEKYADRLKETNIDWKTEDTQEEYAIVDKAGRVQIPREILTSLELKDNKVKLEHTDGKVVISRPETEE